MIKVVVTIIFVILGAIIILAPYKETNESENMQNAIKKHERREQETAKEQEERKNWKRKFWNGKN